MEIKPFKIRCSAISDIMVGNVGASSSQLAKIAELEARDKPMTEKMKIEYENAIWARDNPELPQGAKSYCKQWVKEQLYGTRPQTHNKYVDKGLECEDEAISLVSEYYGIEYEKNQATFESEYIIGTPDILSTIYARDIKCSWDQNTFPLFENEVPDVGYWWQLQGYMIIANKPRACLDYVLVTTPKEVDRHAINYNDVPLKYRIKTFEFVRDESCFDAIADRVELCRKYVDGLLNEVVK